METVHGVTVAMNRDPRSGLPAWFKCTDFQQLSRLAMTKQFMGRSTLTLRLVSPLFYLL